MKRPMGARLYGRLLALLPLSFRMEMGAAMAQAADEGSSASGRRRTYWLRECAGLLRVVVSERLRDVPSHVHESVRRRSKVSVLMSEMRPALRRLRRAPGFSLAAVLTLSLALGAVVSIWAVVKNVVVDPLPYEESDRLVLLEHGLPGLGAPAGVGTTEALHVLYREDAASLESVAIYWTDDYTLTGAGEPESVAVTRVTPQFARVLRVEPLLGRWFDPGVVGTDAPRHAVLSHAMWTTRFGSDPDIVGTTIRLNEITFEVIGVMRAGFAHPDEDTRLWIPIVEPGPDARVGGFNFHGLGRLSAGATLESLRREQDALIARLPEAFPGSPFAERILTDGQLNAQPVLVKERTVGAVARTMWVLLATVGLVLVLACANVANLFIVRSDGRRTEMAVRRALGADRRSLAAQFVAEGLLLSLGGGLIGAALAATAVRALRVIGADRLPRLREVVLDPGVLLPALVLSVVVGLLLGLIPLARRLPTLADDVQQAGRRSTSSGARVRARGVLVATQVALASVLLVACGLMTRSFIHLTRVDPGFDAAGALTFHLGVPASRYPERSDAYAFHDRMIERIGGLPGVTAAAYANCAPLEGWCFGDPLLVEGRASENEASTPPVITMRRTSAGYFETLGMRLVRGRLLTRADEGGAPVIVVNRALVDTYFPGEDAIGQRVRVFGNDEAPWSTIVGIVENTATVSVDEARPAPSAFFPNGVDDGGPGTPAHRVTYVVRAETPPLGLVPAIRAAVREADPDLALADVATLEQTIADSGARISFALVLLGIAAVTALLLGAIGIYGVISYAVARRTGEIGVRLALGARPAEVVRMIVKQGAGAVSLGLAVGMAAAFGFGNFMDAMLFGVTSADVPTYVLVLVLLALLAFIATWIPARRAASLDPVSALRTD